MSEELTKKYKGFCEPGRTLHGLFSVRVVEQCNFKVDGLAGHPFTIGTEHVEYASDHCGGILGTEVMERIPCACMVDRNSGRTNFAGHKCGRPYHAHTSDRVLFLTLDRDLGNKEATRALHAIKAEMEADKIDGVAFMENGFRIAKPESQLDHAGTILEERNMQPIEDAAFDIERVRTSLIFDDDDRPTLDPVAELELLVAIDHLSLACRALAKVVILQARAVASVNK